MYNGGTTASLRRQSYRSTRNSRKEYCPYYPSPFSVWLINRSPVVIAAAPSPSQTVNRSSTHPRTSAPRSAASPAVCNASRRPRAATAKCTMQYAHNVAHSAKCPSNLVQSRKVAGRFSARTASWQAREALHPAGASTMRATHRRPTIPWQHKAITFALLQQKRLH